MTRNGGPQFGACLILSKARKVDSESPTRIAAYQSIQFSLFIRGTRNTEHMESCDSNYAVAKAVKAEIVLYQWGLGDDKLRPPKAIKSKVFIQWHQKCIRD